MMSDDLPPTNDKHLQALSKMIDIHFQTMNKRFDAQDDKIESVSHDLRERITEVKDNLRKSDETFEKRVDKIDRNFESLAKEHKDHLISYTESKTKADVSGKNWNSFISVFAGAVASVLVTIVTKLIGF